jgi:hypothetical protein
MRANKTIALTDPEKKKLLDVATIGKLEDWDQLVKSWPGLTAETFAAASEWNGFSALHVVASKGIQGLIPGDADAELLLNTRTDDGITALHFAIEGGFIETIPGGVTATQLAASILPDGTSALRCLVKRDQMHLVRDGLTFAHLAGDVDEWGVSAVHIAAQRRRLDKIPGGVTASQLSAVRDSGGFSALQEAAAFLVLDQIRGGVTADQMHADRANDRYTALMTAADYGSLHQIDGGIPTQLRSAVKWDRALRARLADHELSFVEIQALLKAGASVQLVDKFIRVTWAVVQGCDEERSQFLVVARGLKQTVDWAGCDLVLEPTLAVELL